MNACSLKKSLTRISPRAPKNTKKPGIGFSGGAGNTRKILLPTQNHGHERTNRKSSPFLQANSTPRTPLKSLQARQPDIIILFGCSLVGREIMECFPNRIINLHVGLSGEYRGSSCNFWPIYDGRLDCLGATLLKINAGIDTGEILAQETIEIAEGDTEQSLMGKSLILGMDLATRMLHQGLKGNEVALPLARNGKLFQKNDFTPEAISKVKEMVESGHLASLIKTHLKARERAT